MNAGRRNRGCHSPRITRGARRVCQSSYWLEIGVSVSSPRGVSSTRRVRGSRPHEMIRAISGYGESARRTSAPNRTRRWQSTIRRRNSRTASPGRSASCSRSGISEPHRLGPPTFRTTCRFPSYAAGQHESSARSSALVRPIRSWPDDSTSRTSRAQPSEIQDGCRHSEVVQSEISSHTHLHDQRNELLEERDGLDRLLLGPNVPARR